MCQDCREDQATETVPYNPERDIQHAAKRAATIGGGRLVGGDMPDKPLSSNESAMLDLENELMELDEAFSTLQRRLQPVMNEESQKMAEASVDERTARMPVSELARSINEKASRVRSIRYRVTATIRSIDL